jgi:hypothetical protein
MAITFHRSASGANPGRRGALPDRGFSHRLRLMPPMAKLTPYERLGFRPTTNLGPA